MEVGKVVILAGGLGSRLAEETEIRPKPLVEIGGRPILWHIMKIYSEVRAARLRHLPWLQRIHDQRIFRQLRSAHERRDVRSLRTKNDNRPSPAAPNRGALRWSKPANATMTGGRIRRVREHIGDKHFCLTYGDGVAEIDIPSLVEFHDKHGLLATVTAVQPPGRFGALEIDAADRVLSFREKATGRRHVDQRRLHGPVARRSSTTSKATTLSSSRTAARLSAEGQACRLSPHRVSGTRWIRCATSGISKSFGRAGERRGGRVTAVTRLLVRKARPRPRPTGFKGAWLSLWLRRMGAKVEGVSLPAEDAEPIRRRRAMEGNCRQPLCRHPRSRCRDEIMQNGPAGDRVPSRRAVFGPALLLASRWRPMRPTSWVRFTSWRRDERRHIRSRRGRGDQRQVLREPRVVAGLSRRRADGRSRSLQQQQGLRRTGHGGMAQIICGPAKRAVSVSLRRARATSSAAATGRKTGLIPDCIRALKAGQAIGIRNPASIRPWQHVLDPLCGYLILAERLTAEPEPTAKRGTSARLMTDAQPVGWIADRIVELWGGNARWEKDRRR